MKPVAKPFNKINLQEEHANSEQSKPQHPWRRGTEASGSSQQCKGMKAHSDGIRVELEKHSERGSRGKASTAPTVWWCKRLQVPQAHHIGKKTSHYISISH